MSAEKVFGAIYNYWRLLLFCAVWIPLIIRYIKEKRAPVKSVKAVVAEKYIRKSSKYPSDKRCVVVFAAGKEKLSFSVSEFSYAGYKLKEKGTLKYKGNRIIDFKL